MEPGEFIPSIDWEEESYPHPTDFFFLLFFALFFPSIRFFLDRFVLEVEIEGIVHVCCWILCIFHIRFDFLGDKAVRLWGINGSSCGNCHSHCVILHIQGFRSPKKLGIGPRRINLFRFARVGSVVLGLHDASDVFLEMGKMSKYSHYEKFASLSFIFFVASWVVLRLTYFPFWILRSTSYEVLLALDKDKHKVEGPIYYYLFNTLLFCLLVLHIYWWMLIYRMLVRQIKARGQLGDDVRSDSDGEHDD